MVEVCPAGDFSPCEMRHTLFDLGCMRAGEWEGDFISLLSAIEVSRAYPATPCAA